MIRPLFSLIDIATPATTTYYPLDGGMATAASTTLANIQGPVAITSTIYNVYANVSVAPGVGTSVVFTLIKNGSATSLVVTISGTNTSATNTTTRVSLAQGDLACWQVSITGSPAASFMGLSCVLNGQVPGYTTMVFGASAASSTGATQYIALFGNAPSGTEASTTVVSPIAGTLDRLYVNLSTAPTAGKSYAFTLRNNTANTALTTTVSDASTSNSDLTHSVSISAGDLLAISIVPSGTPTASFAQFSMRLNPIVDGESPVFGRGFNLTNSAATYQSLLGAQGSGQASETSIIQTISPMAISLKKLYLFFGTAPSLGKSWVVSSRKNSAGGNLTATMSDTANTASDTTNSDSLIAGDVYNWLITPSGTPTASGSAKISAVTYIQPTNGDFLGVFM